METTYTTDEENTLKLMRNRLAKNMGITLSDNHVSVRFNDQNKRLCSVTMQITHIDTGAPNETCDQCGGYDNLESHKVQGAEHITLDLCEDCRSPK
jgi:hypothetical protein